MTYWRALTLKWVRWLDKQTRNNFEALAFQSRDGGFSSPSPLVSVEFQCVRASRSAVAPMGRGHECCSAQGLRCSGEDNDEYLQPAVECLALARAKQDESSTVSPAASQCA